MRQQLNEMIEDEKGLVSIETFRRLFFTFFKGERSAYQVYDMLQPAVSVHFDEANNCFLEDSDSKATPQNKFIQI